MKKLLLAIFLLQFSIVNCQTNSKDFPILKGPYLGQKPPGDKPEIFAPGIISNPDYFEHSAAIFSPEGNEVYWTAKANNQKNYYIYFMKMVDGIWSKPKIAEFCIENKSYEDFTLSADGQKLYFSCESESWFVEKQNGAWSNPNPVSSKINSEANEYSWIITNNSSAYFIRFYEFDIYVSRVVNGDYGVPEKLGQQVNSSDTREYSVYVAPDESYMIIEATKDARQCDLFISYRKDSNSWSERIKLPISWGRFPFVSPDGKYLFFMTHDGIYWVSTKIIKELRPKE